MLTNPERLSLGACYAQASRQAGVQRAPDGLPVVKGRWHIRVNSSDITSVLQTLPDGEFIEGPPLTPAALSDPGELKSALRAAASMLRSNATYVETVLHICDEVYFSLQKSGAGPQGMSAAARLGYLRSDPSVVMAEDVKAFLSTHTYIDVPGSIGRQALRLSRSRWEPLRNAYDHLCKSGLYRLQVVHGALETAAVTAKLANSKSPSEYLLCICFTSFGLLAAVGSGGSIELIRRIDVSNGEPSRDLMRQITDVLTSASLRDTELVVVETRGTDSNRVIARIQELVKPGQKAWGSDRLSRISRKDIAQELVRLGSSAGELETVGPEHLFWYEGFWDRLTNLRDESAGTFAFRTSDENAAILPQSLGMYPKLVTMVRPVTVALTLACVGWAASTFVQARLDPAWSLTVADRKKSDDSLQKIQAEFNDAAVSKDRMSLRAGAALTAVLCNGLFPEGAGITLEKVSFDAMPQVVDAKKKKRLPIMLVWSFKGKVTSDGQKQLELLAADSSRAWDCFRKAAAIMAMPSLSPSRSSDLKLTSNVIRNQGGGGTETAFELRLERFIPDTDALALPLPIKEKAQ